MIPTFSELFDPLLEIAADGQAHRMREVIEILAERFQLSPEERSRTIKTGETVLSNRAWFANTYLYHAGMIERPERGAYRITERGLAVLKSGKPVTEALLREYPEFKEWIQKMRRPRGNGSPEADDKHPPEERMEAAYEEHRRQLAGELVDRIKSIAPDAFERMVLHLLVAMGYGGSYEQAAQAVGRAGDQGVDGVINQDPLGLDRVYVQAKRWDGPVGSEPVRNFVGSLAGHHASKGVFITTSHFTDAAWRFVETVPYRVVLIDGETMAQLMIRHGVGVTEVARYPICRIDTDFFEQL